MKIKCKDLIKYFKLFLKSGRGPHEHRQAIKKTIVILQMILDGED